MFNNYDIEEYFDTTQAHYKRWWKLEKLLSLHYGIWDDRVKSFPESLVNTNRVLMEICGISEDDKVLDAGCGVGGAAFFLHEARHADVIGISLSKQQIDYANVIALKKNLTDKVSFKVMDFTATEFNDNSFDVVWACESVCMAPDKEAFIRECYRLLKKGGRLVMSDYFLTNDDQEDRQSLIRKWCNAWALADFIPCEHFTGILAINGFSAINTFDYTDKIKKSAKHLFYSSLLGALPSELYNLFHPSVSRFAKSHYKSGWYQYRSLVKGLWRYFVILAVK
jgi:SAM-dependent methyltransferase